MLTSEEIDLIKQNHEPDKHIIYVLKNFSRNHLLTFIRVYKHIFRANAELRRLEKENGEIICLVETTDAQERDKLVELAKSHVVLMAKRETVVKQRVEDIYMMTDDFEVFRPGIIPLMRVYPQNQCDYFVICNALEKLEEKYAFSCPKGQEYFNIFLKFNLDDWIGKPKSAEKISSTVQNALAELHEEFSGNEIDALTTREPKKLRATGRRARKNSANTSQQAETQQFM